MLGLLVGTAASLAMSCAANLTYAMEPANGQRVRAGVRREVKELPSLSVHGMVGAVSMDRATGALRWLCMGNGAHVSTKLWSMSTTAPATLHLARSDGGYVLRTWGEHRGRVAIQGPGLSADLMVHERLADGKVGPKVVATVDAGGTSVEIEGGKVYELVGK